MRRIACLAAALLAVFAFQVGLPERARADATGGSFSVLTYNVAGLPEGLSSSHPAANTPLIGARLGDYDVVHVQEDFNYHAALYAADQHPYRTPTSGGAGIGDGLNTLSDYPHYEFARVTWNACNGTDCLTPKGFTWSRIRPAEGVYIDVYNLHANAGTADADLAARRDNISQLSRFITGNSTGNAVIVMGDTNTRYTRAGDNIRLLGTANGLTDAWVQLVRNGTPPAQGSTALVCDAANVTDSCEVVDKVLYRSSRFAHLDLTRYHNENAGFLDGAGGPLSDHYPITARFSWTLDPSLLMSDFFGGPHGTPFTDLDAIALRAQVSQLAIRTGARVDQVGVALGDGTRTTHGGTGGSPRTLTLAADEHLSWVTLAEGQHDGHTRVFYVEFHTNLGRVLSGGTPTPDQVTFFAPAGWQITAFHGRSGDEVDRLGMIYTPVA